MRCQERLQRKQPDAEREQCEPSEAARQGAQRVKSHEQAGAADHAWEHRAGVVQLQQQAQAAHAEQDVGNGRVGNS